jgi:hypothetical protein
MKAKLYALIDPRNGLVMYIGKTCNRLEERLTMHLCQGADAVICWGAELGELGLKPEILLIDEAPMDEWRWRERDLIEAFPSLLNKLDGGGGVAYKWALPRKEYFRRRDARRRDRKRLVSIDAWEASLYDADNIINGQYYDTTMEWGRYSDSQ